MTDSILNITDVSPVAKTSGAVTRALPVDPNASLKPISAVPLANVVPDETVSIQTHLATTPAPAATNDGLKDSVNFMNHSMKNIKRDLSFSIDTDSNRTVIKVLDSKSGNVIRQIPTEQVLDMVNRIKESTDAQNELPQGLLFSEII